MAHHRHKVGEVTKGHHESHAGAGNAPSLEGAEARQRLAAARVLRVQPVELGAQVRQHDLQRGKQPS